MDAEEVSKRCVVFKNVPSRTSESQFRLWLDHMRNRAFRNRYTEVLSYFEDLHDKRWIVLFRNEKDARQCIDKGDIEIETESGVDIKINPDYCSECIVPEEWLKEQDESVNINSPEDPPFNLVPKVNNAGAQFDEESINSEDLFSEQFKKLDLTDSPSRKSYSGSVISDEGRISSSEMFGSGKGRPTSTGSVDSSALFGSGRNSLTSGGFSVNQKGEKIDDLKNDDAVVSSKTNEIKRNGKSKKLPKDDPALIKSKDTSDRSQPAKDEIEETGKERIKSDNVETGQNSLDKIEVNITPDKNSPSHPFNPMFPGYPYPYAPFPGISMPEGMNPQLNPYGFPCSHAYGTSESTRQSFQFPMMPHYPMMPPQVPVQEMHGTEGQGQENPKVIYVPVPMAHTPMPSMQAMPGFQGGAQMHQVRPGAIMPHVIPGAQMPHVMPQGIPGYYPAWPYGMIPNLMPNAPSQQQDMDQINEDKEGEDYLTPVDDLYITPIDVDNDESTVNKRKDIPKETREKSDTSKRQGRTSKDEDPLDSSGRLESYDGRGYLKLREELKAPQSPTEDDFAKDYTDETVYESINEMTLAGDQTMYRISERIKEKKSLEAKSSPPLPKRPSSMPLKSPDENRNKKTPELQKNPSRVTIFEEGDSLVEGFKEKIIKIEGIHGGMSQETLELWVERQEVSGGAEVVSIKIFPEKEIAIVEMKYAADVETIMKKQKNSAGGFKLNQKKVRISVYTPTPVDPRRLFISGMKEGTSRDNLQNFIEVCCSSAPTTIEPGLTPGTALLTFDTPPDLALFKVRIKQRSLENHYLEVSEVEVSQSVKVKGYSAELSHDSLMYYFENTKRSGGGEVERVEYQTENNVHIVHFLQPDDAVNVCKRHKHTIGDTVVTVSLYYPCLDLDPQYRIVIPEPLELHDLNPYIVRFLMQSSPFRMKLEAQMKKNCSASVLWPTDNETPLKLVCDLNPKEKGVHEKVEDWNDKCHQAVDVLCDNLDVNDEIHVAKEVWNGVCERLRDINIAEPDMVMVSLKKEEFLVVVFGLKELVVEVSKTILGIVSDLEQTLAAERQPITKSKMLKTYQAALLRYVKFPEKSTTSGLSVSMNDRQIEFSGGKKEVDLCIQKMYQRLKEFARRSVPGYMKTTKDLLFQKEARNYIKKQVNKKGLLCVWDVIRDSELVVYSKTEKELDEVVNILMKTLSQTTIALDTAMTKLTQSKEWEAHLAQLRNNSEYVGLMNIEVKLTDIHIAGVDLVFQRVYDDISKFFDLHGDVFEFLEVEQGRFLYITQYKKLDIKNIEKQYRTLNIRIDQINKTNRKGFKIHGKKDGCRLAIARIQELVDNITYKDITIAKTGFKEFLLRAEGKVELHNIEISEKCVLLPEITDSGARPPSQSDDLAKEAASCKVGSCSVRVMEGDITGLAVDAVVNPTSCTLGNSIGLGSSIIDKGGFEIQRECEDFIRKNSSLAGAEVFVSKAGKLACKRILHVAIPSWKGGTSNERSILRTAVENCLKMAAENNCKSIAMTIMGAGERGYPKDVAARNIVTMINRYFESYGRSTSVDTILLCERKSENVQVLIDELKNKFGSSEVQVYKDADSSYSSGSSVGSSGSTEDCSRQTPFITVKEGELNKQNVDVLVNSANQNLDLHIGIVSRGLLKAGGDVIQSECNDKYPNGIKLGDVAKTTGGNLNCKKIFHGMLQQWDGGQGQADAVMGTFIQRCLTEAERGKYKSIAFPALGTGNLGFPPDVVANVMFKCVCNFQAIYLRDVKLVVWHGDTSAVKAFNDVARQFKKKQQISRQRVMSEGYQPSVDLVQNPGKDFKTTIENVTVQILQGDITKQKTGAIVNSVLEDLNLSNGRVSKAILEAGGTVIQTECLLKKAQMKEEGLVVTAPGKLFCQKIIHLKAKYSEQGWEKMIYRCLQKVESLGLNSVSFPALGTGGRGVSPDVMGKSMMSSFRQYITSRDYKQCLKSVRIVIYETAMLDTFIKSVKENPSGFTRVKSYVKDLFMPKKTEVSNVKIHVYIDSLHHSESVRKKLEDLFWERKIYLSKLLINKLDEKQLKIISSKGEMQNVRISFDAKVGCFELQGYGDAVNNVCREIESYLKKVEKDIVMEQASASVIMPKCWSRMSIKDPLRVENLSSTSFEYVKIFNKFTTEAGGRRVIKIERIQNPTLFTQFISNKHQMEQSNKGSPFPVERCLWHGTSPGAVDNINKTGFNRNFNSGSSHGVGVYFAVHASTSLAYCRPDTSGHYHMYYAYVLTGDCCVGSPGIRHPPAKNQQQPMITYDSTTDNPQAPTFFVIFHDSKAYPSYHIEFQ